MSEYFTIGGYIIAEVDVEANSICGSGRAELPVLLLTLRMLFRGLELKTAAGTCLDFREIIFRVSPFEGTYITPHISIPLRYRVKAGEELSNQSVWLQIPLDRTRMALLNRLRKGGDVKLRLDMELLVDELVELARAQHAPGVPVWGLKEHHQQASKIHVDIPRSRWVEQILPGTEFGNAHIIELPAIPIDCCAEVKAAFGALQHAQRLESQGFYGDAAAQCRVALEPFFERVEKVDDNGEKKKVPVLKSSWQTRLGKSTYDWLNSALIATKQGADGAHHVSSTSFDQLEAQMLLTVTTSLIAYAVKTMPDAAPQ